MAKKIFAQMLVSGQRASAIAAAQNLKQVSDSEALQEMLRAIFAANPAQVEEYKAGKDKLLSFFVGQAMRMSKGQANPALLNQLIEKILRG
jgi:aspartyl-tRNA(Asn)/glutamyl-tRNA(Gln) amidotransferase subunit B